MQCCSVFGGKTLPLPRQDPRWANHSLWIHSDMRDYSYYVCPVEYHRGWFGRHHTTPADAIAYRDQMERESGFEWRIVQLIFPK